MLLKSSPVSFQTKQDKLTQKGEKGAATAPNAASAPGAALEPRCWRNSHPWIWELKTLISAASLVAAPLWCCRRVGLSAELVFCQRKNGGYIQEETRKGNLEMGAGGFQVSHSKLWPREGWKQLFQRHLEAVQGGSRKLGNTCFSRLMCLFTLFTQLRIPGKRRSQICGVVLFVLGFFGHHKIQFEVTYFGIRKSNDWDSRRSLRVWINFDSLTFFWPFPKEFSDRGTGELNNSCTVELFKPLLVSLNITSGPPASPSLLHVWYPAHHTTVKVPTE